MLSSVRDLLWPEEVPETGRFIAGGGVALRSWSAWTSRALTDAANLRLKWKNLRGIFLWLSIPLRHFGEMRSGG
jgi:hypothetical protein